jgi:hypothetical protein
MFGEVIGDTLDRAQWIAEGQTNPTYENAVTVCGDIAGKSLQIYPNERGFVLKLMLDGKCNRQVQTGIMVASDGRTRCDLDSLTAGAKKLGFTSSGTGLFAAYAKALGEMKTSPVVMIRASADGTTAVFTVVGGMKDLRSRTITIKIGTTELSGGPDSREVKEAAAPFTEFVRIV